MPYEFRLDRTSRIVHTRAFGMLSGEDLLDHAREIRDLFSAGELDGSWSQLIDFSEVTSFEQVSIDVVREMAARNPWPPSVRRVLLSPSPMAYGLSRMYQMMTDGGDDRLTVVRTCQEAMAILEGRARD